MAMDLDEEQARSAFHKMVELLWMIGSRSQKPQEDTAGVNDRKPEDPASISPIEPEGESETVEEILEKDEEESAPKIILSGYGGFLYIKCPVCGKTRGFCAKTRLNNFRCECGAVTRMEHMVPLYMKCECGRQARYMTNMTEAEFDVNCYDCGAPVAMRWNEKKGQYETMR